MILCCTTLVSQTYTQVYWKCVVSLKDLCTSTYVHCCWNSRYITFTYAHSLNYILLLGIRFDPLWNLPLVFSGTKADFTWPVTSRCMVKTEYLDQWFDICLKNESERNWKFSRVNNTFNVLFLWLLCIVGHVMKV